MLRSSVSGGSGPALSYFRRHRIERLEDRRVLAPVTVTTELDTVDFTDGLTSLREAIFATNTVPGADTIECDASLAGKTILLENGELDITDDLIINGLGAGLLTIDASGNDFTPDSTLTDGDNNNDGDGSRVFNIDDGDNNVLIDVEIYGLTLTGGDAGNDGGAVFSRENLSVGEISIKSNSTAGNGAGVWSA